MSRIPSGSGLSAVKTTWLVRDPIEVPFSRTRGSLNSSVTLLMLHPGWAVGTASVTCSGRVTVIAVVGEPEHPWEVSKVSSVLAPASADSGETWTCADAALMPAAIRTAVAAAAAPAEAREREVREREVRGWRMEGLSAAGSINGITVFAVARTDGLPEPEW